MSGSHNTHARLAPSAAKRWTTCTASVKLAEDNADRIPEEVESAYAKEGTQAHDHAETILRHGHTDYPEGFDELQAYVDYCRSITPPGVSPWLEAKVGLFYDTGEATGTCDYAVVTDDLVEIVDLKWGQGVQVDPVDNPQLAIYAFSLIVELGDLGVYEFHGGTVVRLTIVQPRHHAEDTIRTWEILLTDLEKICRDIEYRAIQIREGRGLEFAPSEDACRWCPCKAFCKARVEALAEPVGGTVDALALLSKLSEDTLDEESMVALFKNSKGIRAYLDDLSEYLTDRALAGTPVAGTKLVMGREGNRQWADEDAADTLLKPKIKADDRYTRKLISPTQAEKLCAEALQSTRFRNRFEKLVSRSPAKQVITTDDDKRPAVQAPVANLPNLQ